MWQTLAACLVAMTLACCSTSGQATTADQTDTQEAETKGQEADGQSAQARVTLDGWQEDSEVLSSLVTFVAASVDKDSDAYIPPEDRIAVFDLDGTLMGERFPTYFQDLLCVEYASRDDAPKEFREQADTWRERAFARDEFTDEERRASTELFAGMTVDEFKDGVRAFKKEDCWGFSGMTYGSSFFEPMASVVSYLSDNDYAVYVCSGSWTDAVRVMLEGNLDAWIPDDHVIGTDLSLRSSAQGDEDSLDHTMGVDEELVLAGGYGTKNLKTNKVIAIENKIGKHPVLAFGNSGGDVAMGNYALNNPNYPGQAYMLLCDDTERDYGDPQVAADFAATCEAAGFHTVSMADDWTTIYPEGAQKVEPADEAELAEAA